MCDFEAGTCNWLDWQGNDDFNWTIGSGPTESGGTGPDTDHTFGTGELCIRHTMATSLICNHGNLSDL